MNNNYSLTQRNELVEKYLWCIDTVIRKNRQLLRSTHLEYDDCVPAACTPAYQGRGGL